MLTSGMLVQYVGPGGNTQGVTIASIVALASGFSGFSAYSGFSGIGTSGYSGLTGSSGNSGASAWSGTSGFSGTFSGFSGFSGNSGKSGYSGISGPVGISGTSGTRGTSGYSGVFAGGDLTCANLYVNQDAYVLGDFLTCSGISGVIANDLSIHGNAQIDQNCNAGVMTANYSGYFPHCVADTFWGDGSNITNLTPPSGTLMHRFSQSSSSDFVTSSGATYIATGFNANVALNNSGNSILMEITGGFATASSAADYCVTSLAIDGAISTDHEYVVVNDSITPPQGGGHSISQYFFPNDAASHLYEVYIRSSLGSTLVHWNGPSIPVTMTIYEVQA